jgi:hypothetical protein
MWRGWNNGRRISKLIDWPALGFGFFASISKAGAKAQNLKMARLRHD